MISSDISRSVKLARVACIFLMMYTHAYLGRAPESINIGLVEEFFFFTLYDVLGRGSVPLLSIISGFLLVHTSMSKETWGRGITRKAQALLVPMIAWNVICLAVIIALTFWKERSWPQTALDPLSLVSHVTGLLHQPINEPLGFLRDLFVCICLAPALLWALKRHKVAVLLLTALLASLNHLYPLYPVLLRTQILFFFTLGLCLSVDNIVAIRKFLYPFAICAVVLAIIKYHLHDQPFWIGVNAIALRTALAGAFWGVLSSISGSGLALRVMKLEPAIFLAFCSHIITYMFLRAFAVPVFGLYGDPLFMIYFIIQPVAAVAVGYVIWRWFSGFPMFKILNAGKAGSPQAPRLWPGNTAASGEREARQGADS